MASQLFGEWSPSRPEPPRLERLNVESIYVFAVQKYCRFFRSQNSIHLRTMIICQQNIVNTSTNTKFTEKGIYATVITGFFNIYDE